MVGPELEYWHTSCGLEESLPQASPQNSPQASNWGTQPSHSRGPSGSWSGAGHSVRSDRLFSMLNQFLSIFISTPASTPVNRVSSASFTNQRRLSHRKQRKEWWVCLLWIIPLQPLPPYPQLLIGKGRRCNEPEPGFPTARNCEAYGWECDGMSLFSNMVKWC